MLDVLFQLAGRAHPLFLHLPIGILAALVMLELLALAKRIDLHPSIRAVLAWLTFAAAAASVVSGLLLEREPAYSAAGETLQLHKWLGIAVGVATLLAAVSLSLKPVRKAYPLLLTVAFAAVFPAGHLGATLTHGEGFLTEPLMAREDRTPVTIDEQNAHAGGMYARQVAPIFERYCVSCHGEDKAKGDLALHTPEAIRAGGQTGPTLEPGDPENSEILIRMRLPVTNRDHMPPRARPQPDDNMIAIIERWIEMGAPFAGDGGAPDEPKPAPAGDR